MKRVLIITDSNAGIRQDEAKQLGIKIVPMPFIINGEEYYEDINLSQEEFYEKLQDPNANISTSQPSAFYLTELWDECLKECEEIVYIPMSSGLSATCENAKNYAEKFDKNANLTTLQPLPRYKNRTRARLPTARLSVTLTPYVYVLLIHSPMGLRS
jgi:DegV family protein with EDD domain